MQGDDILNPYAAPREAVDFPSHTYEYFVQDNLLVVRDGSQLPDRCVLTNEPTGAKERVTQQLIGAPSFSFVLNHRTFKMTYSVSKRSQRKAKFIMLAIGSGLLILWLTFGFFGWSALMAVPIFFFQAFFTKPKIFSVKRAQDGHYWVKGCGRPFLESLALDQLSQMPSSSAQTVSAQTVSEQTVSEQTPKTNLSDRTNDIR